MKIRLSLAEDLPNIECSPIHMQKVLMNLIRNAVEAFAFTGTVFISPAHQLFRPTDSTVSSLEVGEFSPPSYSIHCSRISKSDLKPIF